MYMSDMEKIDTIVFEMLQGGGGEVLLKASIRLGLILHKQDLLR